MVPPSDIQARLEAASAAVRERDLINDRIASLDRLLGTAQRLLARRRATLVDQRMDVKDLETFSVVRILSTLRGSPASDLERERAEVEAARLRVAEVQAQCDSLAREVEALRDRVRVLGDVDTPYREAQAAKASWLGSQKRPEVKRLAKLAGEWGRLQAERRELEEVAAAADGAIHPLQIAIAALDRAGNWPAVDAVPVSIVASATEQDHLSTAAWAARQANLMLARLSHELSDIGIEAVDGLEIGKLTLVFDVVFDTPFTYLMISHRIDKARTRIERSLNSVTEHQRQVADRRAAVERRLVQVERERAELLA